MKRREFITLIGSAAAWPISARGQQRSNPPLVAFLFPFSEQLALERAAALRLGLKQAGLVEGSDFRLEIRFADGDLSRLPELAKELDSLRPRVIAAFATAIGPAAKQSPNTPIVFSGIAVDPIAAGLAKSYARPGGRMTGVVMNAVGGEESVAAKRIGLFKELVPNLTRIGMIGIADSETPNAALSLAIPERNALRKLSAPLGFEFLNYDIRTLDDFQTAVVSGLRDDVGAFYISGDPRMNHDVPRVAAILAKAGKPTCAVYPFWTQAGLLMSYSNDIYDAIRRSGFQVAQIIRGANAGEVPLEQAVKFTLAINQKTARQLGITPSPALLAQADEVIE